MKILYISPNGYLGGAERFVCNAAQGHLQSGEIDFHILFFSDGDAAKLCRQMGATVEILPIKFKMRNLFLVFKVCNYIRSYILKHQFVVIHSTMPYAHILSFFSTLFLNIKRIWFQHGPVGGILDKIANLMKVDLIYFNSLYLEKEHLKMPLSARNKSKHKMINYGILESSFDQNEVDKITEEYLVNCKYLFLSAGRLCPWKGQLELIEAIHKIRSLHQDFLENVKFLIIGSYGRIEDKVYEDKVKSKIREYHLEENIFMLGHKNNIQDYYHACHVFLHTSTISEPFGLVVAESMKNNCLVIGSDSGGVRDILIDNKTGFTFPSTKKDASKYLAGILYEAFLKFENEKDKIENIKSNARNLINTDYTVEKMTEILEYDAQRLINQ